MKTRRQSLFYIIVFYCGIVLTVSLFGVLLWIANRISVSVDSEVKIANNIGRIRQLDEVLTMSARLAAYSKRRLYRDRYLRYERELNRVIKDTLALVESPEGRAAVKSTDEANQNLVRMEIESFALLDEGNWEAAANLLENKKYIAQKRIYARGMEEAFADLKRQAAKRTALLTSSSTVIQLLLFIVISGAALLWHRVSKESRELHLKAAQYEALRITMTTVMDTFNNALQIMLYFKQKAAQGQALDEREIMQLEHTIDRAKDRLWAMRAMAEFKTRERGGTKVLAFEISDTGGDNQGNIFEDHFKKTAGK